MTTEATAIPRLKEFKFRVEVDGLPVSLVGDFDPGDRKHGLTEHSGAGQNFASKEAGAIKFEPAVLKNVVPVDGAARGFWEDKMNAAQNPATGNGGKPSEYMFNFSLYELKPDGNPSRAWEFFGGFVTLYKLGMRNSMADNKDVIEEVHIEYQWRELRVL
jgi:hypothetical protein